MAIRFTKPTLIRRDMDAVLQTMVDEKIGPGERKKEFVRNYSAHIGKKDGIVLRTYPDAIAFTLRALSLSSGDVVALSIFTPNVVCQVLSSFGLDVRILDSSKTSPISEEALEEVKSEGLKAVYLFEPMGFIPESKDVFASLGVPVIEDISESMDSYYEDGIRAGDVGDVVITSFEERSLISSAGGSGAFSGKEAFVDALKKEAGKTGRYTDMPDLNASLGNMQLLKLEETMEIRREIARAYQSSLQKSEAKPFLPKSSSYKTNGYAFPLIIDGRIDDAKKFAKDNGVEIEEGFSNAVGYKYRNEFERFPNGNAALSRCLVFPLYPMLKRSEIDTIEKVIRHIGG